MKTRADYIDPEAIENCETCGGLGHVVGTEDGIRIFYTCEGCEAPIITEETLKLRAKVEELQARVQARVQELETQLKPPYSRFILHRDYEGEISWVEPTLDALMTHLMECDIWLEFTDVPAGFTLVKKEEV